MISDGHHLDLQGIWCYTQSFCHSVCACGGGGVELVVALTVCEVFRGMWRGYMGCYYLVNANIHGKFRMTITVQFKTIVVAKCSFKGTSEGKFQTG